MDKDAVGEPFLPPPTHPHPAYMAHLLHGVLPARLSRSAPFLEGHRRPHRRHHHQLGLLAARRANVLVRARHHGALSRCAVVYAPHRALPYLSLAADADGGMVRDGAVGAADTCRRGSPGDILESRAYLLHRHQHGRDGSLAQAVAARCGVAAARYVPHDVRHVPIS